jgi:hypothetical protein
MSVSLVIPVRDEAGTIEHTLDDLLAQSRRPDEVVFVDAGSRDGTPAAIAAHALARTLPVRVVQAGAAYPGRARNLGVAASEGNGSPSPTPASASRRAGSKRWPARPPPTRPPMPSRATGTSTSPRPSSAAWRCCPRPPKVRPPAPRRPPVGRLAAAAALPPGTASGRSEDLRSAEDRLFPDAARRPPAA